MSKIELGGFIEHVGDTQQISEKFSKRDFVLRIDSGKYTEFIRCEATNASCDMLNGFKQDEEVKISVYLTGRKYNKPTGEVAYFTSVKLSAINKVELSTHAENIPF
jgi:single-strand DNA-binding protein